MNSEKELMAGGELQFSTGSERLADAGVCMLSGVPLVRGCVSEHVARIDRAKDKETEGGPKVFRVTAADGHRDTVEAGDRRHALLKWHEAEINDLRKQLASAHKWHEAAIETAAIAIFNEAIQAGGATQIGGWAGIGYRGNEQRVVRTNDLFRFAALMGYVCHLRNDWAFFGTSESECGKAMHRVFGSGAEE